MESNSVIPAARPWLWPNLLSLDAPVVALLWQLLFARCFHAGLNAIAAAVLALCVWLIYAADRMLDAWTRNSSLPRHEFYRRHWRTILPVWSGAFALAIWLAWTRLPTALVERGMLLATAVALYFALVHLLGPAWPKELAVAILFALGASIAAWSAIRSPAEVEGIALFSFLCWINCAAIDSWEIRGPRWPVGAAALVVAAAAALAYPRLPVLSAAEMASALAFIVLDHQRARFSRDALRVLADVALMTPAVFLPVSGMLK